MVCPKWKMEKLLTRLNVQIFECLNVCAKFGMHNSSALEELEPDPQIGTVWSSYNALIVP